MNKNKIEAIYPLSYMQEGMLYHKLLNEKSSEYCLQDVIEFTGDLKYDYVKESLKLLGLKHDVIRTAIALPKKSYKPWQLILKDREIEFNIIDISEVSEDKKQECVEDIEKDDIKRGFDFERDSLIRMTVIKLSDTKNIALWSSHHIISDGWCTSLLFKDFIMFYGLLCNGETIDNIKDLIKKQRKNITSYKEYINWLNKQDKEEGLSYFENLLSGYETEAKILQTKEISTEQEVESLKIDIDDEVKERLIKISKENSTTLNTILEMVWGIVLEKYCYSNDVVFGKVVSGRNIDISGIEETVGLFINTIPVRLTSKENSSCKEILSNLSEQSINSTRYEYCSLADIQNRTLVGNGLINSLFVFENYYFDKEGINELTNNLDIEINIKNSREKTNYPINLLVELGKKLTLELMYDPKIYDENDINRIFKTINLVLDSISNNINILVSEIPSVDEEEKNIIINEFNNTKTEYPYNKSVVEIFEDIVKESENLIAIEFNGKYITYKELNEKANALAYKLKDLGIEKEDSVAIFSNKSIEVIIGLIAILKAGAAYVPILVDYPRERIDYILKDCNAKAILVESLDLIKDLRLPVIDLSDSEIFNESNNNLDINIESNNLAYILYTSGTTGHPKGTLIEHKSIVRLVKNSNINDFQKSKSVLQTGAISFDASTFEIWGSLLNGCKLCLIDNYTLVDSVLLKKAVEHYNANTMFLTTSLFNQIVLDDVSVFNNVENLVVGGEKMSEYHAKILKDNNKDIRLINGYGPTENTTFSTIYEVPHDFSKITIGQPVSNSKAYILNGNNLCAVGMLGELCVAGDGVARGYLNRDDINKEKFMYNILNEKRIYRTGDLARFLPDGNIEYLGRIDNQVKIRGFRIELDEISNEIQNMSYIKDSTVIVVEENGEKYLCGYIVSDEVIELSKLKEDLNKRLPNYMRLSYLLQIDNIPLTVNGKTDVRKLPKIEITTSNEYIEPRNETEEVVAKSFKLVLGVDKVGINDSFFELGGHSLKASRLINQIEYSLGIRLPIKTIFNNPTVAEISEVIINSDKKQYERIEKAEKKDYYKMASNQKRIYTLWEVDKSKTSYNMPVLLDITNNYHINKLNNAVNKLIERHEILRTSFHMIDGEFIQRIHGKYSLAIQQYETDKEIDVVYHKFIIPFDLNTPKLFHVNVIKCKEKVYLFFDIHHIISDGFSMNLIISEFMSLYNGEELEEPRLQYRDYSEWINNRDFLKEKEFWMDLLKGDIQKLNLPLDRPREKKMNSSGDFIRYSVKEEVKKKIDKFCSKYKITNYMFFLGILMVLFSKYSRTEDIIIGSPISGRENKDTERILGMFINTIPFRGYPKAKDTFYDFINQIKEVSLKAFDNQLYPLENIIKELNINSDLSRNPLFDILFTMQNNQDKTNILNYSNIAVVEDLSEKTVKADIDIEIIEKNNRYDINFGYATKLFNNNTINRFVNSFNLIIDQVLKVPNVKLKDIEIISNESINNILDNVLNNNLVNDNFVFTLLEEVAHKKENKLAIYEEEKAISYKEFNSKSNQLARKIRSLGIKPNDKVVISAKRSINLLISIYAVLKAGACYIPVDVDYPKERIDYIVENSNAKLILLDNKNSNINNVENTIYINDESNYVGDDSNLKVVNNSDDLAYIIYTSGTTGKPKGVQITHKSLINYVIWGSKQYFDDKEVSMPLFTSIAFDLTVTSIFLPIVTGNSIVVYKDNYAIEDICKDKRIKIIKLTPAHLTMIRNANNNCYSIKKFILGGEELLTELADKIIELYGDDIVLYNEYGPTEATVGCMIYAYTKNNKLDKKGVPIGKAIDNVNLYVFNNDTLCGIGMIGELCIAGIALAKGYDNAEELTKERFVENPYRRFERIYKTGDLVRWTSEEEMEYLGRIDEQVKIRGYRIELSEIQNVLLKNIYVKDVVVIVREDDDKKFLCAYYVVNENAPDNIKELLMKDMKKILPYYMIPQVIEKIDEIPLTINGKIDKKALPDVNLKEKVNENYVTPKDELEIKIAEIWSEVLGIEKIGVEDDFFEIGGDSIHAIRIISKMREVGYECTISELMELRTISSVKRILREILKNNIEKYQYSVHGKVKLSPIQKEFFNRGLNNINHYNQSILLENSKEINKSVLEKVMKMLVNYHDILRSKFSDKDENTFIIDSIGEANDIEIFDFDLRGIDENSIEKEIKKHCENIQETLDITNGELVKCAIIRIKDKDLLFITIHHLIIDGVSWRIILEDIQTIYTEISENNNEDIDLPLKSASYKTWIDTLYEYKETYELRKEKDYWVNEVNVIKENCKKISIERNKISKLEKVFFELNEEESNDLLNNAQGAFNTEIDDLLLASLALSMNKWRGDKVFAVDLESHGRTVINNIPVDRTVGWFTSLYPVVFNINNDDLRDNIVSVKEKLNKVNNNGIGYGILKNLCAIEELKVNLEVSFNYLGIVDSEVKGDFKVSNYEIENDISKENNMWNPITIVGSTKEGITTFEIIYEEDKYSHKEMINLANIFKETIIQIVDFCINKNETEYSSSDFGENEWDDDEIRGILDLYD